MIRGTTDEDITWHTSEIDTVGVSNLTNVATATGYGWAQYEPYQALIQDCLVKI